ISCSILPRSSTRRSYPAHPIGWLYLTFHTKRGFKRGTGEIKPVSTCQAGRSSDSFNPVEYESLLPQATSAAIATAALAVASHAVDQTHRTPNQTESVEKVSDHSPQ